MLFQLYALLTAGGGFAAVVGAILGTIRAEVDELCAVAVAGATGAVLWVLHVILFAGAYTPMSDPLLRQQLLCTATLGMVLQIAIAWAMYRLALARQLRQERLPAFAKRRFQKGGAVQH